jgi:hypothetical protein
MKSRLLFFFAPFVAITLIISCSSKSVVDGSETSDIEKWKLGWRLVSSSWDKNYQLAEQQFDSLLRTGGVIETKFFLTGFEVLSELGKREKIESILSEQDPQTLDELCTKQLFVNKLSDIEICKSRAKEEEVANKALQIELIEMYIKDQAVRGNVMNDMITKYKIEQLELPAEGDAIGIDKMNRDKLKEIIARFGFPTKQLVGKDAMQGIFMIIQHSDGDPEWQKAQLPNVEKAVRQGDMDGQSYAYLYDRIKINSGEKQLYGTQFKYVDPATRKVEMSETEDIENLDRRRMEMGMMPMKMYEQFMLDNL